MLSRGAYRETAERSFLGGLRNSRNSSASVDSGSRAGGVSTSRSRARNVVDLTDDVDVDDDVQVLDHAPGELVLDFNVM